MFSSDFLISLPLVVLAVLMSSRCEGSSVEYDSQICLNKTNGCSIPWNIPFPYKNAFRPACDRHDVCYQCGSDLGWTRLQCDNALKRHMSSLCSLQFRRQKRSVAKRWLNYLKYGAKVAAAIFRWIALKKNTYEHCMNGVDVYYKAVRGFSETHFVQEADPWCKHPCVVPFGSPHA